MSRFYRRMSDALRWRHHWVDRRLSTVDPTCQSPLLLYIEVFSCLVISWLGSGKLYRRWLGFGFGFVEEWRKMVEEEKKGLGWVV